MNIQQLLTSGFPSLLYSIFTQTAPFIILGLILTGWIAVVVPVDKIRLYLGENNLRSAFYAALFGLPLPVCSCSAIPIAHGLKEKKASRESILSFLISGPETSADTFIFTWGLMGPLFAVVRPVTSFLTSIFTAALSIAERTDRVDEDSRSDSTWSEPDVNGEASGIFEEAVGLKGLYMSISDSMKLLLSRLPFLKKRFSFDRNENTAPFSSLVKKASDYGFVYTLDNLSIWFIIGLVTSALIAAFLPGDIFSRIPGGEITEILFMLIIGIPMYVCSFESTPIAAVLIMKGLSPGAALVFLLAGPATNLSGLIMLLRVFGRKFIALYLSGIAIISVSAGLIFNLLIKKTAYSFDINLFLKPVSPVWKVITAVSSVLLLILLVMSLRRLPWKSCTYRMKSQAAGFSRPLRKKLTAAVLAAAAAGYLASGIFTLAPGMEGFTFTFGKMTGAGISEGIHWHLPRPFGRVDKHPAGLILSTEIGYTLTPEVLQRWKSGLLPKIEGSWDSFFTNYNSGGSSYNYLLGDENQIDAKFSVHYTIKNPASYYYGLKNGHDKFIDLAGETVLRKQLAKIAIDDVLTTAREDIAAGISENLQRLLDSWDSGVEITSVNIVDLHPPSETVASFREVASAMEDRQTIIHEAYSRRESSIPAARARAAKILEEAKAFSCETALKAASDSAAFAMLSDGNRNYPEETGFRLYLDSMKKNLTGRTKLILPAESSSFKDLNIWSRYEQ